MSTMKMGVAGNRRSKEYRMQSQFNAENAEKFRENLEWPIVIWAKLLSIFPELCQMAVSNADFGQAKLTFYTLWIVESIIDTYSKLTTTENNVKRMRCKM